MAAVAREFKVRGRWVRWEPKGTKGSIQELTAEEWASEDLISARKYLQRSKA